MEAPDAGRLILLQDITKPCGCIKHKEVRKIGAKTITTSKIAKDEDCVDYHIMFVRKHEKCPLRNCGCILHAKWEEDDEGKKVNDTTLIVSRCTPCELKYAESQVIDVTKTCWCG